MSLPAREAPRPLDRNVSQTDRTNPLRVAWEGPPDGCAFPARAPRSVVLRVTADREGLAEVRDFTRRALDGWALEHRGDDVVAVVTELVANAVVHAAPHAPAEETDVRLRLSLRSAHVVCAVSDPSDSPPLYPHSADPLDERGRGLRLVEALSDHWGWTRRTPAGKAVWAMLPTGARA
ncbi:ATP-binding protein [Streptomyces sp. NPDC046805]|uniref:ATP-binding protein n=1 Tax=Streptomyces sp. NPDC046805 TaxID=3155134 RepID=UPI0033D4B0A7